MTGCPHGMPSKGSCVECMYDTGLGGEPTAPVERVAGPFPARFDGDCNGCCLAIHVGQPIIKLSDDSYVHEACGP